MLYKLTLSSFIFVLLLFSCAFTPNISSNNPNQINEKIKVLVSNKTDSCQQSFIKSGIRFFEKKWNKPNVFKLEYFLQEDINYTEAYTTTKWRTIVFVVKDPNEVKDEHGDVKAAYTRRIFGEAQKNNKEVFKGLIELGRNKCYFREIYLHEYAHVFGENHIDDPTNIMNSVVHQKSRFNGSQLKNAKRIALGYIL